MNNQSKQLSLFVPSDSLILKHIIKDGCDLYFDTETGITGISINGLARLTGIHKETIRAIGVKLNALKTHQALTVGGLQGVKLILDTDIPQILEAIKNGNRTAPAKKIAAANLLTKLAQAGFRLMVMLEISPETIAKVAIDKITDHKKAQQVAEYADAHAKYLETYKGLTNELKRHGAKPIHYASVNKFNNDLVGIEKGKRDQLSKRQKGEITMIQLAEELKLEKTTPTNPWGAVTTCKEVGQKVITALTQILDD